MSSATSGLLTMPTHRFFDCRKGVGDDIQAALNLVTAFVDGNTIMVSKKEDIIVVTLDNTVEVTLEVKILSASEGILKVKRTRVIQ